MRELGVFDLFFPAKIARLTPMSEGIGNLRPGTAERVVREELARMQSHSSERTLIATPRLFRVLTPELKG